MSNVRFGPGGTSGLGYVKGINEISRLGLGALEVEFTHGVQMTNETAQKLGEQASENDIKLSVHAPYYVNLASDDSVKVDASCTRILDSCERANYMKAKYVVFHAGFYQKKDPELVFNDVKRQIEILNDTIKSNGWKVKLAPETTGKPTQFGSLNELMQLHKETGCHVCVDFAHLRAREQGEINYDDVMKRLKPLKHIHSHFSGIEWTEKGEKRHLLTTDDIIIPFVDSIARNKMNMTVINESPDPINDALRMKELFEVSGRRFQK